MYIHVRVSACVCIMNIIFVNMAISKDYISSIYVKIYFNINIQSLLLPFPPPHLCKKKNVNMNKTLPLLSLIVAVNYM